MGDRGKTIFGALFVVSLFIASIIAAGHIQDNEEVAALINAVGPLGILIVAFIGGLNLVVPVPSIAFIPIFTASGFSLPLIILLLIVGITVADLLAFYLGTILRPQAEKLNVRVLSLVRKYCHKKPRATQLIVFVYAAIIPLPNEVLLLPLGAIGVKLRTLAPAFVLGTAVHVTLLSFILPAFV